MASEPKNLTKSESRRVRRKCPVECAWDLHRIESLADFMAVVSVSFATRDGFWFRGHRNVAWDLVPGALRSEDENHRSAALHLVHDFRRVAELKLPRLPDRDDHLQWMQLAQHYGIPTRLLDWTESAIYALYFACIPSSDSQGETDGVVFLMHPDNLSVLPLKGVSPSVGVDDIAPYLEIGPSENRRRRLPTIAITPVLNSERLLMQRGAFTLHGAKKFSLDREQAPSLYAIPILAELKCSLLAELARIGVDEMTLFPELEHACAHLKRRAGLGR